MAQTSAKRAHIPHLTLNTDGKRHPLANTTTTLSVLFALVAIYGGFRPSLDTLGAVTGALGMIIGLWAQMISATTAERFLNIIAIGVSFVGFGLSMAHGAF